LGEALLTAFPSTVPPEDRFLVLLEAYFDESGTHDGSKVLTVAGYIGDPAAWVHFEGEWRAALEEYGLEFFHMNKFAAGAPPVYARWTREQRLDNLKRLIDLTNRHAYASVGVCVPLESFQSLVPPDAQEFLGGPYGFAAIACFFETARLVRAHRSDGWISYVLESGGPDPGVVANHFKRFMQRPELRQYLRLQSLRFDDKRVFTPLQAADILAYELYRHLPKQLGNDLRLPRLRNLRLLAEVQRAWMYATPAVLRDLDSIWWWKGLRQQESGRLASDPPGEE
jgi:Protein of unknown function (DUF3800)